EISSFIDTAGSNATRNADDFYLSGANSSDFYNEAAGTVLFDYTSSDIDNKGADIFEWSNTGTATDFFRAYQSASNVVIFARTNSALEIADLGTAHPTGLPRGQRTRFAIPYAPNDAAIIKEGLVIEEDASFNPPRASVLKANPTLTLLNRRTGTSIVKMNGIVHHFAYYDERLSNAQCMAITNPNTPGEVAVALFGDNNLLRWSSHFSGAVQAAFKSALEACFTPVYVLNKGEASSSCTQVATSVTGGSYWLATAGTNGSPLEEAIRTDSDSIDNTLLKLRRRVDYIILNHGLFDGIGIKGAALSGATYETRMGVMLDSIKTQLGPQVKFVLQTPLSYNDAADTTLDDASLQAVRKAQLSLAASRSDVIGVYDAYDAPLADTSHATEAGYTAAMNRAKNIILHDLGREALVAPPQVNAASYSGSTITLTLSKAVSGTEYGIFRVTDDGSNVTVSSMNINGAGTTLTLTLASPITGGSTVKLWVAYGKMDGITHANVPKDADGYPIQSVDEYAVSEG
ncbi:MAG TPA: SwmB domain-containing protein, partial [Alphaproteobacteria bacterium]|nr:SwmB domain-containing protein [Alphaproteobacteria bacterium]